MFPLRRKPDYSLGFSPVSKSVSSQTKIGHSPGGGGGGALRFLRLSDAASAMGGGTSGFAAACGLSPLLSMEDASRLVFVFELSCVLVDSLDEFPGDSRGDMFASSKPLECELLREWSRFFALDCVWSACTATVSSVVEDALLEVVVVIGGVTAPGGGGGAGALRFVRAGLLGIFAGAPPTAP